MSQQSTPDSSELGESIDIDVIDRRGEVRESLMRAMESEMEELKRRNQELEVIVRNTQGERKRVKDEEKDTRRKLKQLEKENEELRERLFEVEQSHLSELSSREAEKVDFKQKPHKLRSKSIKSKHLRESSLNSESSCVQLKVFDSSLELRRLQTENLVLQKQVYELKESLLVIEHQRRWSTNLADKMIDLAEKLSAVFKEELFRRDWDAQKRAKVSWRYLKHVIKHIFSDQ